MMDAMLQGMFDLAGRTAVVTGASRGIGTAAAEILAAAGANVVIVGREAATLEHRAHSLAGLGARVLPVVADMGTPESPARIVQAAVAEFGTVDILVNNAGIIRRAPAVEYSEEDWNAVMDVNATGTFLLAREAGRLMVERRSGKIINIASLLSFSGGLNVVAYTASKSAVAGLTRALANEWARHGVNVNAIAPGYIHTEATAALRANTERYNALAARIPAGHWGEPDDLKGAVLFLASAASNYVHGHILAVDGGWLAA